MSLVKGKEDKYTLSFLKNEQKKKKLGFTRIIKIPLQLETIALTYFLPPSAPFNRLSSISRTDPFIGCLNVYMYMYYVFFIFGHNNYTDGLFFYLFFFGSVRFSSHIYIYSYVPLLMDVGTLRLMDKVHHLNPINR